MGGALALDPHRREPDAAVSFARAWPLAFLVLAPFSVDASRALDADMDFSASAPSAWLGRDCVSDLPHYFGQGALLVRMRMPLESLFLLPQAC